MSDNPLGGMAAHDRVSIRTVLVEEGQDPGPALTRAGIFEPIALIGGILGDGMTPHIIAVLDTGHQDASGSTPHPVPETRQRTAIRQRMQEAGVVGSVQNSSNPAMTQGAEPTVLWRPDQP